MTMRREKATVYDEPPEKWVGQNYMNHNLKIIKDNKWSVTSLTLKMNAVYVFSLLQWMRKQIWLTPPARQNRRELVIWNHLEVSPFLNLLGSTRAATNLVLTQVIISERRRRQIIAKHDLWGWDRGQCKRTNPCLAARKPDGCWEHRLQVILPQIACSESC